MRNNCKVSLSLFLFWKIKNWCICAVLVIINCWLYKLSILNKHCQRWLSRSFQASFYCKLLILAASLDNSCHLVLFRTLGKWRQQNEYNWYNCMASLWQKKSIFFIGFIYYQSWYQLHIVNEVYRVHSEESKQFHFNFSSSLYRSVRENRPDI